MGEISFDQKRCQTLNSRTRSFQNNKNLKRTYWGDSDVSDIDITLCCIIVFPRFGIAVLSSERYCQMLVFLSGFGNFAKVW